MVLNVNGEQQEKQGGSYAVYNVSNFDGANASFSTKEHVIAIGKFILIYYQRNFAI